MTWLPSMLHDWYDPAVGRWLSEDPVGLTGGEVNLYCYVSNTPLNLVDSGGEKTELFDPSVRLPGKCRRDQEGKLGAYFSKDAQSVSRVESQCRTCMLQWTCPDGTVWDTPIPGTQTCQRTVTYVFPPGTRYTLVCVGGYWRIKKADQRPIRTESPWKCGPCLPDGPWPPSANPIGVC